ncbi:MAG: hypothetical protein ACYCY7_03980 [Gallionella sp.]
MNMILLVRVECIEVLMFGRILAAAWPAIYAASLKQSTILLDDYASAMRTQAD